MWWAAATFDLRRLAPIALVAVIGCVAGDTSPTLTTDHRVTTTIHVTTTPPASSTTTLVPATTSTVALTATTQAPGTTTTQPLGYIASTTKVTRTRLGHSWRKGCPVHFSELRLIRLTYWGFDGQQHEGDLVVHATVADDIVEVFARLYDADYPIVSVIPIGDLPPAAEDQPGYANTSGFNCRFVEGTSTWSEHAKGLAIDLNVQQNPYVKGDVIWPEDAGKYVDRSLDEPGMIKSGDAVVDAFASVGWGWGGYWKSSKDYQHFSLSGT